VTVTETPISSPAKRNRRGFGYDYDSPTGIPDEDQYGPDSPTKKKRRGNGSDEPDVDSNNATPSVAGPSNTGGGPAGAVRSRNNNGAPAEGK
jgi:hypothetical protein